MRASVTDLLVVLVLMVAVAHPALSQANRRDDKGDDKDDK